MSIAGSDSISGAGIQADIKTAYSLGFHAVTVITAITAQNSLEVSDIFPVPADFIKKQMETLLKDIRPDSVKIGMIFSADAISCIREEILKHRLSPVVLDPIIRASVGRMLLEEDALERLKKDLFPVVDVITPNIEEAEILCGIKINSLEDVEECARRLKGLGPDVVITGYYKEGFMIDVAYDGKKMTYIKGKRVKNENNHGSGCVFSTALSAFLAKGKGFKKAAMLAHKITRKAIKRGYQLGKGKGPVRP